MHSDNCCKDCDAKRVREQLDEELRERRKKKSEPPKVPRISSGSAYSKPDFAFKRISAKEVSFYRGGFPVQYASATVKDEKIRFDIGVLNHGFLTGGQMIKDFRIDYAENHTYEEFVKELSALDIMTDLFGKAGAEEVLRKMWDFLKEEFLKRKNGLYTD